MCIRDSPPTYTPPPVASQRKVTEESLPVSSAEMESIIRSHCLLYTSDAADERSSVDLGGRRIIKKKSKDDVGVDSTIDMTRQKFNYDEVFTEIETWKKS